MSILTENKNIHVAIPSSDVEKFDDALSDILCWMDGYKAAGGEYSPGSLESLRSLRLVIQRADDYQQNELVKSELQSVLNSSKHSIEWLVARGLLKSENADIMSIDKSWIRRITQFPEQFKTAVKSWVKRGKK